MSIRVDQVVVAANWGDLELVGPGSCENWPTNPVATTKIRTECPDFPFLAASRIDQKPLGNDDIQPSRRLLRTSGGVGLIANRESLALSGFVQHDGNRRLSESK